jgi:outer membrane protein assembly factor BamA
MRIILFLIINLFPLVNFGQNLQLLLIDADNGKIIKNKLNKTVSSPAEGLKQAAVLVSDLQQSGYLLATADSFIIKSDTLKILVNYNKIYKWAQLKNNNLETGALNSSGFKEKIYRNKKFSVNQTARLMQKLLLWYENQGYPFAQIQLDSVEINNESFRAQLKVNKGELFIVDSVTVKGTAKITNKYLQNYIGIKPGDVYNESALRSIETRLKELPFVTVVRQTDVFLLENSALVRMYLNGRKASNFSGIIGVLPNNQETGKLLLTGEANLKLKNSLGRGEAIEAEWRRLQAGTQSLNLRVAYPFLFNTQFGADGVFNLYKRDSTFLNLHRSIGIQYLMRGTDYLKVYLENKSSSLLSTKGLQNLIALPDYADISSNIYGLELNLTRLDYRLNPRKGFRIISKIGAGNRTIKKNAALNPELYEGLKLKTLQFNGAIDSDIYFPLFKRATLNVGFLGNWLNSSNLFENELSRIGGNNSLRGFNEESIFAASYLITNLEYRYLLEENSFLFAFINGAWYENKAINRNITDTPYGFGAGISFQTKAGIFSISYALGKQFNNPIEFRTAKVHFGITSLF